VVTGKSVVTCDMMQFCLAEMYRRFRAGSLCCSQHRLMLPAETLVMRKSFYPFTGKAGLEI
jgi:hypothetical protein